MRYFENYRTARQATDDKIWRMRFACWINKVTHTYTLRIVIPTAIP
jgi:hypothetical protein